MKNRILPVTCLFSILLIWGFTGCRKKSEGPYFATGIRIGEVSDQRALVWVRLTADSLPGDPGQPMPEVRYQDPLTGEYVEAFTRSRHEYVPELIFPAGYDVHSIEGGTRGIPGDVMIYYKPFDQHEWENTEWHAVDPGRDHTVQIALEDLLPGEEYEIRVVSRYPDSRAIGESLSGSFTTAPAPDQTEDVLFTVSTGQAYPDQDAQEGGFRIYNTMMQLDPDFFVHTGDILYYDDLAKTPALARWHWSRMYSLPTNIRFHRHTSSYFIKDDHDTWVNDCWPGMESRFMGDFTFEQGQQIFLEQVPMPEKTYRTYRWGKDLQIWLMEGRDYRSPNTMEDGPEKTIWGEEQIKWLQSTVEASDATYKLLISPTPIVGPDRQNKRDNHSNQNFSYEGNMIREWISTIPDMYVICGDRHWQYISVDDETGIREYSCGPASDQHAGGWSNDMIMPEHRYLNVTGGFLSGKIETDNRPSPLLIMTHYDVDGEVLHTDTLSASR